jgi:sugar lactone lactonase YvrE
MNGNIFTADMETGRIQQFDPAGKFVRLWDAGDGKVYIRALEVDQNGILYAAVDRTIRRYDTRSGSELEPLPNPENYFYEDFIVLPNGGFGALVDSETLVRLNPDGSIMWMVDDAISSVADESDTGGQLAVDGNNNFFLAGRFVESVFKYSADGRYLNRFGSEGEEPGQLDFIHAIAVDGQGGVYLNDWGQLEIFESDGRFVMQAELPYRAYDIQFGPEGYLYTVTREGKVFVYQIK